MDALIDLVIKTVVIAIIAAWAANVVVVAQLLKSGQRDNKFIIRAVAIIIWPLGSYFGARWILKDRKTPPSTQAPTTRVVPEAPTFD